MDVGSAAVPVGPLEAAGLYTSPNPDGPLHLYSGRIPQVGAEGLEFPAVGSLKRRNVQQRPIGSDDLRREPALGTSHLNSEEWCWTDALRKCGHSVSAGVRQLGRPRETVSRELNRNAGPKRHNCTAVDRKVRERRRKACAAARKMQPRSGPRFGRGGGGTAGAGAGALQGLGACPHLRQRQGVSGHRQVEEAPRGRVVIRQTQLLVAVGAEQECQHAAAAVPSARTAGSIPPTSRSRRGCRACSTLGKQGARLPRSRRGRRRRSLGRSGHLRPWRPRPGAPWARPSPARSACACGPPLRRNALPALHPGPRPAPSPSSGSPSRPLRTATASCGMLRLPLLPLGFPTCEASRLKGPFNVVNWLVGYPPVNIHTPKELRDDE